MENIQYLKWILLLPLLFSCSKVEKTNAKLAEEKMQLSQYQLAVYSSIQSSNDLIVFEAGLGDDHSIWAKGDFLAQISSKSSILLYDRAGYGKSTIDESTRGIAQLSSDLSKVIDKYSNGRKVILVGHSLGGMIIRDYAIKNPSKVSSLLFIDPSHEAYNTPTQAQEDLIYNAFLIEKGTHFGGTREARQLVENTSYLQTLPPLPNIPVIVLTSMKTDLTHSQNDRQKWFSAHQQLSKGVSNFLHLTTNQSGHYIMLDEPNLVLNTLEMLLRK
ncbi:MAG: alpha/beta hydrolase [Thermoflexibacter sp.]|jgi:pimeloyl-ACP methyl ester carboxylesterase|nr:alpha/beta hydrolase [Thermoflexibacter sp.]